MAAKGYMTDFGPLRDQFDLTVGRNKGSTAWNLYRGFQDTLSERRGIIYKQDEEEMTADESFGLLEQLIKNNSAGGGDFTIYFPKKGAAQHQHGSIFFRVENYNQRQGAGLGGFPSDPRMSGYLTREDLEKERRLWEAEQRIRELEAQVEAPPTFLAGIAQQAVENGTVERLLSGIMGLLEKTVTGFAVKHGAIRPAIQLNGIDGQDVNPTTPPQPQESEGSDYPEEMYQFADYIFDQIGNDPNVQRKFWTNLKFLAQQQPALIQQILQ